MAGTQIGEHHNGERKGTCTTDAVGGLLLWPVQRPRRARQAQRLEAFWGHRDIGT